MDLAKSCLRAYDKLAEENERLRQERDDLRCERDKLVQDRNELVDKGEWLREIRRITEHWNGRYEPPFIDDAVRAAIDQAQQNGAQRERERIARLFDDLYPEWAQMIREGFGDE
jgi:chromosome segregation ATPase